MNDYFKSRTECFLYLKILYTFAEEYGDSDILSLEDYEIHPDHYKVSIFWDKFRNLPNVRKTNDTEFFFFSLNLLLLNKDGLGDNTVDESNFEIPEKKEFTIQFDFTQRMEKSGWYYHSFETFAELDQIEKNIDEISEDWRDYYNEDWEHNSDGEFTNIEISRVYEH